MSREELTCGNCRRLSWGTNPQLSVGDGQWRDTGRWEARAAGWAVGISEKLRGGRRGHRAGGLFVCFPGQAEPSPPDPVGSTSRTRAPPGGAEGDSLPMGAGESTGFRVRRGCCRLCRLGQSLLPRVTPAAQVTQLRQGSGERVEVRARCKRSPEKAH